MEANHGRTWWRGIPVLSEIKRFSLATVDLFDEAS